MSLRGLKSAAVAGLFGLGLLSVSALALPTGSAWALDPGSAVTPAGTASASGVVPVTSTSAATPQITVTPSTDLSDGQSVEVSGSGFDPGTTAQVSECESGATSPADCYQEDVEFPTVDSSGDFTTTFQAARLIDIGPPAPSGPDALAASPATAATPASFSSPIRSAPSVAGAVTDSSPIDCADTGACVVGVVETPNQQTTQVNSQLVTFPIEFDPSVPPPAQLALDLSINGATSQISLNGNVDVNGQVSCNQTASVDIQMTMSQQNGAVEANAYAQVLACGPSPSQFTATFADETPVLEPGPASLEAQAWAYGQSPSITGRATADVAQSLTLVGAPSDPNARYYVALGDSLAIGYAAPAGQGYVDDLLAHYSSQVPGLQLVDFGVSGETTQSFIDGGQLKAAEAFLSAHASQVSFLTIDIGGNDIVACGEGSPQSGASCAQSALTTIATNLHTILQGLRQADGSDLKIFGMNYFNPLLIEWLLGPAGQSYAQGSTGILDELNTELQSIYAAYGAPTADVASAFRSDDFTDMVSSQWGSVPENVYLVCSWTDVTCTAGGPEGFGDDANAAGYTAIAGAYETVIDTGIGLPGQPTAPQPVGPTPSAPGGVPTPPSTTSPTSASSNAPAAGGSGTSTSLAQGNQLSALAYTGLPVGLPVLLALGLISLGAFTVRLSRRTGARHRPGRATAQRAVICVPRRARHTSGAPHPFSNCAATRVPSNRMMRLTRAPPGTQCTSIRSTGTYQDGSGIRILV
jgi:lysophospholipase L1-like esterase